MDMDVDIYRVLEGSDNTEIFLQQIIAILHSSNHTKLDITSRVNSWFEIYDVSELSHKTLSNYELIGSDYYGSNNINISWKITSTKIGYNLKLQIKFYTENTIDDYDYDSTDQVKN